MSKRGDNIRKRNDGRWEGRYKKGRNENGTIKYGSVYGKTYREVKEKLVVISSSPNQTTQKQKKNNLTFSEVLKIWMDNNRIRLKGGSLCKYQKMIDMHIGKDLGSVKMTDINANLINSYLSDKLNNGRLNGGGPLSASYVKSMMLIINAALNYAVQEQLCQPLRSAISKPVVHKKELIILSSDAQKQLEVCVLNDYTPTKIGIYISLYTGLRIGEVCALKWEDIDLTNGLIHIRHTIARVECKDDFSTKKTRLILDEPKTDASKRVIPIPSILMPLLLGLRRISCSEYVVSGNSDFVSPRTYEYRYHQVLKECGIKSVNYHVLRHTFATRCIEAGVDVKSLSEILGHANVTITLNTYVHSSIELKRIQLEKVTLCFR